MEKEEEEEEEEKQACEIQPHSERWGMMCVLSLYRTCVYLEIIREVGSRNSHTGL